MVDAAVGSKSVLGRAMEATQGLPIIGGAPDLKFLNFISADIERASKENPSEAITGFGGSDRGTPGEVSHAKALKYDLTVDRVLPDLVSMYGAPSVVIVRPEQRIGSLDPATIVVTASGTTGYVTGQSVVVTDVGGGSGAIGTVVASAGTVTGIVFSELGDGYVTPLIDLSGIGDGTATATVAASTTHVDGVYVLKIRPGAASPVPRSMSFYFYEGGSYPASVQQGRRCSGLSVADASNKRVEVTPAYTEPIGDSIYGFTVPKSGNAGTQSTKLIAVRGRRPYDSNYTAPYSLFIKVISTTSTTVVFKAAWATPSGRTDGTDFPTPSFGSAEFTATRAAWATAVDSNAGLIGLFGENNEPFELTIGDQAGTLFTANDIFEIPVVCPALTKTVVKENRLSTFHLTNAINGASVLVDSGTTKWDRPYKEYYSNSRRLPSFVDPTGDIAASMTFQKRLYDIAFREIQEASDRASVVQTWAFGQPLTGAIHEGIEIFYPQMRVDTMKSGDVPNKNTLAESITLMAEQPDAAPLSQPTSILTPGGDYFDLSAQYPYQINVVCRYDPSWLLPV